jgi:protein-tyrosine phosphatase
VILGGGPIRVDVIPESALSARGRIGMTLAPGRKGKGSYAEWDRDLNEDLRILRADYDTNVLVTLVRDYELDDLGIPDLFARVAAHGMDSMHLPITDGGVPTDPDAFRELVIAVVRHAHEGRNVVVHCRAGLGRTGMFAAACLVAVGVEPEDAMKIVRSARTNTIETQQQEAYVRAFARSGARFVP